MVNHDNIILKCIIKNNRVLYKLLKNKNHPNISNYIKNRYKDSDNIIETIYRMRFNIEEKPKCPICSKPLHINLHHKDRGFTKYCSLSCANSSIDRLNKIKETNIKKYGANSPLKNKEIQEKIKKTNLEKYGTEYAISSKEIRNKIIKNNVYKYGVKYVFELKEVRDKIKNTCLKKYGQTSTAKVKEIRDKQIKTNLEKYGVDCPLKSKEIQEKINKTNIERYGVEIPLENNEIQEKIKKTCLEKYGVENPYLSPEIRQKINISLFSYYGINDKNIEIKNPWQIPEIREKIIISKIRNHTINTSKPEENLYKILCDKYGQINIKRQYKCKRYPWHCDFYIVSKDLFIELQGYYTHGEHPFDANNIDDIKHLNELKVKYQSYYDEHGYWPQIITIWTEKDVEKRNKAKENNLNFIEEFDSHNFETLKKLSII